MSQSPSEPTFVPGAQVDPSEAGTRPDAAGVDPMRLQRMLESLHQLPVGVWIADADGRIEYVNPAGRSVWEGARFTDVDGYRQFKGWWLDTGHAIAPDDWAMARAIRGGESCLDELIEIETFEGRRKVIRNSGLPVRDADGRTIGAVAVNQDVTDEVRRDAALRSAHAQLSALSGQLLQAQEDERRRLASELHDEIGQAISAIRLHLGRALPNDGNGAVAKALEVSELLMHRVRSVWLSLRPSELDDFGLACAVRAMAAQYAGALSIDVDAPDDRSIRRLPPSVEEAAFRVIQEATANAAHHARAGRLQIALYFQDDTLRVRVRDNGCGFDVGARRGMPASREQVGLASMSERVAHLGGRFDVRSAPGAGTEIEALFPIASPRDGSSADPAAPVSTPSAVSKPQFQA